MNDDEDTMREEDRLQKLAGSQSGLDPVLREQIETSLHAGYAWHAKYAKYGVIWVRFFWIMKWGFAAASLVAVLGGLGQLLMIRGYSDWLQWLISGVALAVGFAFFSLMHSGMAAAQVRDEQLAARYRSTRTPS